MLYYFEFNELTPSAPGVVVSSRVVESAASYLGLGIAGPLNNGNSLDIVADLRGAVGGTLDVYVQYSPNNGRRWYDLAHFPQITANAASVSYRAPVSLYTNSVSVSAVGGGLAPSLSAGAMVNGAFGDRARLVMVAGAGTTAGTALYVGVTSQREYNYARTG